MNKGCEKRQRMTLNNDQRINPRKRYNNYKYICTQHGSTAVCKTNANKYERRNSLFWGEMSYKYQLGLTGPLYHLKCVSPC